LRILGAKDYGPAATDEELVAEMRRDDDVIAAWAARNEKQRRDVRSRCKAFARAASSPHASPPVVAWIMERALDDPWPRGAEELARILAAEYAGPAPTAYVNPLPDRDLTTVVRPGRILIDLTHATEQDLLDLVKPLVRLRESLGYHNDPGGRKQGGRNWTKEDFLDELPRARQKLRVMKGRKPTITELADEMGMSDSTFYRYKRDWLSSGSS
jgi:hypothetical protein